MRAWNEVGSPPRQECESEARTGGAKRPARGHGEPPAPLGDDPPARKLPASGDARCKQKNHGWNMRGLTGQRHPASAPHAKWDAGAVGRATTGQPNYSADYMISILKPLRPQIKKNRPYLRLEGSLAHASRGWK